MAHRQLHPTLWRTCRAVANRTRLQILKLLFTRPNLRVSEVAGELKRPRSITSEYLRALESRGLLTVQRRGTFATYQLGPSAGDGMAPPLVAALKQGFKARRSLDDCFRLATAFTHPRRIKVYQLLAKEPMARPQIRASLRMSHRALNRHLEKLASRGFVCAKRGGFAAAIPKDPLGKALAKLAAPHAGTS